MYLRVTTTVLAGTIQIVVEKVFSFVRVALEIGSSDKGVWGRGWWWSMGGAAKGFTMCQSRKRAVNWVAGINGKMNYEKVFRQAQLLRGSRLKTSQNLPKSFEFWLGGQLGVPFGLRWPCAGSGPIRGKHFDTISIWLTWHYEAILSFQCVPPKLFWRTFFSFLFQFFGAWAITQLTQFSICVWVGVRVCVRVLWVRLKAKYCGRLIDYRYTT